MTLSVKIDGVPLVEGIPPSAVQATSAANGGEAVFGGFAVEDPAASLVTVGHRAVVIEESQCSQPRLFTGWTTQRDMGRGPDDGLIVADDRLHAVNCIDLNALFNFRIIYGSDGKRPEETIAQRLAWLLGSSYLSGLIADTGYVGTSWTSSMDEADYRGSYPSSVMDDLVGRTGDRLTYFAFWDAAAGAVGLFWNTIESASYVSTLAISNVLADVNETTVFPPSVDAVLQREPDQVWSEVIVEYGDGQRIFRRRASTEAGYIRRGTSISRPYTKRASTAQSQAEAWLDRHANELDRITCKIIVPPSAAGLITAGQRIQVRFSHLPGYTTWTSMRAILVSATPTDDSLGKYEITLELVAPRPGSTPTTPTCSFVEAQGATPSSPDVWGATYNVGGFIPVSPVPAVTQTVVGQQYNGNAITFIGTANNGSLWGINSCVTGWAQTIEATWTWDLGSAKSICTVLFDLNNEYGIYGVRGSTNGTDWTVIVPLGTYNLTITPIAAPYPTYRYIQVWWQYTTSAGLAYMPGVGFSSFMAWEGTGSEVDETLDVSTSTGSPIIETRNPTVNDDAEDGYTVGQLWVNTTTDESWVLTDSTVGAAVWVSITNAAGDFVSIRDGGKEQVNTVAAAGATETIDLGSGNVHDVTLSADCTLTFSGATNGVACSFTLLLRQDATGGWDTTWPGSVVWAGGSAPTLDQTASSLSVLTFFTLDGGTTWYGFPTGGAGSATVDVATISALGFVGPLLMQDGVTSPPVPVETEAGDDWLYADL